jgi:hypothetical protein
MLSANAWSVRGSTATAAHVNKRSKHVRQDTHERALEEGETRDREVREREVREREVREREVREREVREREVRERE